MAGTGYNIPVSESNAQTPTATSGSGSTYIQFGEGYLDAPSDQTVEPSSTSTAAAAEGNAAASSAATGAGSSSAPVTAGTASSSPNYLLLAGIAIGATVLGGVVVWLIVKK